MSKAATLLYFRSLLWWCGLMAASVWADPLPLPMPLTAGVGVQSAAAHIEYLPETVERDARSVFRVPAARWQHDTGTPNLGFTTQAYWFRVQVHSHDRVDGFLAITYPVLDDVRVHELDVHGRLLAEYRFGDLQPNPALQIPNRYFLTPLRLAAGEQRIFLMRVATQGSLQLPLSYPFRWAV